MSFRSTDNRDNRDVRGGGHVHEACVIAKIETAARDRCPYRTEWESFTRIGDCIRDLCCHPAAGVGNIGSAQREE